MPARTNVASIANDRPVDARPLFVAKLDIQALGDLLTECRHVVVIEILRPAVKLEKLRAGCTVRMLIQTLERNKRIWSADAWIFEEHTPLLGGHGWVVIVWRWDPPALFPRTERNLSE